MNAGFHASATLGLKYKVRHTRDKIEFWPVSRGPKFRIKWKPHKFCIHPIIPCPRQIPPSAKLVHEYSKSAALQLISERFNPRHNSARSASLLCTLSHDFPFRPHSPGWSNFDCVKRLIALELFLAGTMRSFWYPITIFKRPDKSAAGSARAAESAIQ